MKKIAAGLLALAIVFGAAADGAFLDSSAIAASAAAYTEDELKAKVQEGVEYELTDWSYKDYDGDGAKEGFALFLYEMPQTLHQHVVIIRYINSNGEVTEVVNKEKLTMVPSYEHDLSYNGTEFAVFTFSGGGHSFDVVFSVENGVPVENKIDVPPVDGEPDFILSKEDDGTLICSKACGTDYNVAVEYDKEGHRFYIPDSSSSEYTEEELKAKLLSDLDSAYGTEDGWVIKKWIYGDLFQNENKVAIALVADKETDNRYMGYFVSATNTQLLVDEKSKEQLNDFDTFYTDNSVFVTCFYGKTNNHDSSYLFIKKYDGDSMTKTVVYDTKVNEISLEEGKFTKEGDDFYWYWYSSDGSCNKYNVRFNDALGYFWISDEKPVNDYTYTENEDGTITITAYTGDAEELVIPGEIDGKTVSAIGSGIFSPLNGGNKTIKRITVPGSVKTIGEEAFACADALEEVYIEDGVTEIGNAAFASCINLKKITIPKSVTKIGDYAFSYTYRSDSSAFIDVTIYCYKDSTAHKYALGENALNHVFAYVLLDEVSNPDPSSDSTVSADPSSAESGSSSGSTSTSTSSAAASSSGDKTSNPATGVAAGVSIAAVLAGGIIMVTKKTKK